MHDIINGTERKCDFCGTSEWKIRKVGNYMVVLTKIKTEDEIKLACQSCKRSASEQHRHKAVSKKSSLFKKLFVRSQFL